MSIHWEKLDSSVEEEHPTIILGKNILLKIVEDENKQALLYNNTVKKFVSVPNLASDETRLLVDKLMQQEAYLNAPSFIQTLMQNKDRFERLSQDIDFLNELMRPIMTSELYKAIAKDAKLQEEASRESFIKAQEKLMPDFIRRVKGTVNKKQLQDAEKNLRAADKEIERKTKIRLLVSSTMFVCPKCKSIMSENEVASKKCLSCNRNVDEESVNRIPISKVPDEIKKVWFTNLWFEAYFANLLRKLGCKTWVSVHAMGASGILHQVDVLAIRNGTVIVCECKTGRIKRDEVFNFCTKTGDLKAHVSILALIGELPEPQTREFVKKNPAIISLERLGQLSETKILDDLKIHLSIKA